MQHQRHTNVVAPASASSGGNVRENTAARRKAPFFIALLTVLALVVAACGGSSSGSKSTSPTSGSTDTKAGKPKYGGTLTYSIEAKTTAFCPPRGQFAIAAIVKD